MRTLPETSTPTTLPAYRQQAPFFHLEDAILVDSITKSADFAQQEFDQGTTRQRKGVQINQNTAVLGRQDIGHRLNGNEKKNELSPRISQGMKGYQFDKH